MKRKLSWSGGAGLAVAVLLLLAGCSSNNNKNATAKAAGGSPAAAAPAGSSHVFSKAPAFGIDTNKGYTATIKTDKGDIVVELNAKAAPSTVNNFVFLARQHFYDGLTCHRVLPNFVAQCGDPKGDGSGGPGYTIPDEPNPLRHTLGAIAMARTAAPNSAGSQFYITLAPQPQLDPTYIVFGQVIAGQDVVAKLTPRDPAVNPSAPPGDRMISITIAESNVTPTPFVPPAAASPASGSTPRATP